MNFSSSPHNKSGVGAVDSWFQCPCSWEHLWPPGSPPPSRCGLRFFGHRPVLVQLLTDGGTPSLPTLLSARSRARPSRAARCPRDSRSARSDPPRRHSPARVIRTDDFVLRKEGKKTKKGVREFSGMATVGDHPERWSGYHGDLRRGCSVMLFTLGGWVSAFFCCFKHKLRCFTLSRGKVRFLETRWSPPGGRLRSTTVADPDNQSPRRLPAALFSLSRSR